MLILQRTTGSDKSELIKYANLKTAKSLGVSYESFPSDQPRIPAEIIHRFNVDETILYLDENAIISPRATDPAGIVEELLAGKTAAFAVDVGSERDRWNPTALCASQGIFRKNERTIAFLTAWKEETEKQYAAFKDRLALQRALNAIRSKFGDVINVVDNYYRFAARGGYFIDQTYLDDAKTVERKLEPQAVGRFVARMPQAASTEFNASTSPTATNGTETPSTQERPEPKKSRKKKSEKTE